MNSKTFFITSILVVAVVSLITGLITISLIEKPLLAPWGTVEEGKVEVGGDFSDRLNVIIIDDSYVEFELPRISDVVNFPSVAKLTVYSTSTAVNPGTNPRPFVLRNEGNVLSNVAIVSKDTQLFNAPGSYVKVWAEQAFPIVGAVPYDAIDNCALNGLCFVEPAACTSASKCNLPFDLTGTSGRIPLLSGFEYLNQKDEAYLGVEIYVAADEGAGTKQTTVWIIGTKTP